MLQAMIEAWQVAWTPEAQQKVVKHHLFSEKYIFLERRNLTADNRSTATSSIKSNSFGNRTASGNNISHPNEVAAPKNSSTPFIPPVQAPQVPSPPQVELPQVDLPQVEPPQLQIPEFNPQPRSSSQGSQQDFKEAVSTFVCSYTRY